MKMMVRTVGVLAVFVCASCVLGAVAENEEPAFGSLYYDESSPNSNPPSLSLNLAIGGENLDLKLDLAPDLDLDFPVYVIDSNAEQFSLNRLTTKSKLSMYQDKERGAAFMLVTNTDDSGNSTHVLEGLINKKGEAFHLHTQVPSSAFARAKGPSNTLNNEVNPSLKLQFKKKKIKFTGVYDSGVPGVERPTAAGNRTKTETTTGGTDPRHKRDVTGDVYVDVVAVVDYKAYLIWVARSTEKDDLTRQHDALEKARQYYAFVFNSMNMIYKTVTRLRFTIHVSLVGLIIATDPTTLPTDRQYRKVPTVDTHDALDYFKKWVTQKSARLPNHDHFIMFTGYNLSSTDASSGHAGHNGTVCQKDGNETCIIEETGTFESVFLAAHELGHGLSAKHDGDGNYCSGFSHNLMSPFHVGVASEWTFSSCSATYFNSFINNMEPALRASCMYGKITPSSDIPDVTSQMPGQVYNVTQQCQAIYGPDSYFSQATLLRRWYSYVYLCAYMSCWNGLDKQFHNELAAEGTTCGDKLWCINGHCVHDSAAPSAQSDCLFGDQPGGVRYTNVSLTCAELATTRNSICYDAYARDSCCATCARIKRHVLGCEYGDTYGHSCNVALCPYYRYDPIERQGCCDTCNYGTPYTPQQAAIDGEWGLWGSWSSCSVTCGDGIQRRTRLCHNPAPQNGRYFNCPFGSNTDVRVCSRSPCEHWGSWQSWSNCSVTCLGRGTRTRTRTCNDVYGCYGSSKDVIECNRYNPCPRGKAISLGGERTLIVVAIVAVWFLHRDYLPSSSM